MQVGVGAVDQPEREQRDEDLTDGPDREWAPPLLSKFAQTGAEAHSCKGQKECPTGEAGK